MFIIIRDLIETDIPFVTSLIQNDLGYPDICETDVARNIHLMQRHPDYRVFAAEMDTQVVGFIGICTGIAFEINERYARIIGLCVSSSHQNKGIGSALLQKAEEYIKTLDIHILALNISFHRTSAHLFYECKRFLKQSYGFSKEL